MARPPTVKREVDSTGELNQLYSYDFVDKDVVPMWDLPSHNLGNPIWFWQFVNNWTCLVQKSPSEWKMNQPCSIQCIFLLRFITKFPSVLPQRFQPCSLKSGWGRRVDPRDQHKYQLTVREKLTKLGRYYSATKIHRNGNIQKPHGNSVDPQLGAGHVQLSLCRTTLTIAFSKLGGNASCDGENIWPTWMLICSSNLFRSMDINLNMCINNNEQIINNIWR